jgi:hypothetical protein
VCEQFEELGQIEIYVIDAMRARKNKIREGEKWNLVFKKQLPRAAHASKSNETLFYDRARASRNDKTSIGDT